MNREELVKDLTPFGDIGDSVVKVTEQSNKFSIKMTRDGRPLKISIDRASGKIQSTWGAAQTKSFSSFSALLASEVFANLRRWSDAQRELLQRETPPNKLLPFNGITDQKNTLESTSEVEELLGASARTADAAEILLIDGPAGIGKTNLIEQLALLRSQNYRTSPKPLILHVKSRGRVLSNLQDLMAFSLQTIRSQNTYDQIPVLAKHGLIIIAIDGFDELADPNGYEMAWAQLGELVTLVRGEGTLILAGRDTFIGKNRLLRDVPALRKNIDIVTSLTLTPPTPEQARQWLQKHQWTESQLAFPSVSVLLEKDSFALRPVFLRVLAEHVKPKEIKDKHERYLTPLLVSQMIEREAKLFGRPVEAVMSKDEREAFLLGFLCEVARAMADSQVESLDSSELAWISETALGDGRPSEVISLIRNRASVVAFFVNDERPGYKTFMHSYMLNYFLSLVVIETIGNGEIPKFIRRNILGSEFLSVFSDVAAEAAIVSKPSFTKFWSTASMMSLSYMGSDRGLRNIGALAVAALPAVSDLPSSTLHEFHIDDAVVRGTCPPSILSKCEIKQLDLRGADVSTVEWQDVTIANLIADDSVRVSTTFPIPRKIILSDMRELVRGEEIADWLAMHGRDPQACLSTGLASEALKNSPLYRLLMRAARMRQYWLRADSEDDIQASKIVSDPSWSKLSEVLASHGYLREEIRQASGRASSFYHLKHRESILAEAPGDATLLQLFADLERS